jgi:hypothetical protein
MMSHRVNTLHAIISYHRQQGISPVELHANKHTLDSFATEANLIPIVPPDTRSPLDVMFNRKTPPAACLVFDGCKLVVNPRIVGQAILIRPAALMHDDDWLNKIQMHPAARGPQGEQLIMPEGQETPWLERIEPQEQAGQASPEPDAEVDVLAELNRGGSYKVTPTDVLMKAAEGMDKVEHVIVMRFFHNGDVDMASTLDRYGVQGGLMKAIQYVQGQG